jgi:hypothetical protein
MDKIKEVLDKYTLEEILEMNGIDPVEFLRDLVEEDELVLPVV